MSPRTYTRDDNTVGRKDSAGRDDHEITRHERRRGHDARDQARSAALRSRGWGCGA